MKTQKADIEWALQPVHGDSMTFLYDGKMFVKVGPVSDAVEVRFVAHGIQSVSDNLYFDFIEDAYSYYNQQYVDQEKGQ